MGAFPRAGQPVQKQFQILLPNHFRRLPFRLSVILSKAKNPTLGGETFRYAQGGKGEFGNFLS